MRTLHFTLDKMEFLGGGEALLAGRCCRDEIRLGDKVQWMALREGPVEEEGTYHRREEASFEIIRILMYGKSMTFVSPGMTAGLIMPSELAKGLRFGWHLFGEND